jgi:hypothetical protein
MTANRKVITLVWLSVLLLVVGWLVPWQWLAVILTLLAGGCGVAVVVLVTRSCLRQ